MKRSETLGVTVPQGFQNLSWYTEEELVKGSLDRLVGFPVSPLQASYNTCDKMIILLDSPVGVITQIRFLFRGVAAPRGVCQISLMCLLSMHLCLILDSLLLL